MEPLSREHIKDLRMCGELMGAYLRQIRDLEAERDALAAENERLRAALLEADNLIGVVVEDFSTEIRQHGDQLIDALEAFHREHYIPALAALEGGEAPDA